jgi:hypothetical protein
MPRRSGFRWLASASAAAGLALAMLGQAAGAAVVCQKGAKVKLRADECRPRETRLATLGAAADPTGVWEFTGGTLFDSTGLDGEFLVLEADGTGRANLSGGDGAVLTCAPLRYSLGTGRTLVLDDMNSVLGTRVYRSELEGDGLELVDALGRTARFARASAVDPDRDCRTLVSSALVKGLPQPNQPSGLVYDGSELWYGEDDTERIVPVDPATGSAGPSVPLDGGWHVHAALGNGDFWGHCACGGSEEAGRVTRAGQQVDLVETGRELGEELSVEAVAVDPATGVLWLYGWNDANQGRLFRVDASGEPDVLLEAFDLDAYVTGMTFGGGSLWLMNAEAQTVMRVDPATGQVTGTFLIPDRSAYWRGVAAVGGRLFFLGDTGAEGALLAVEMP